MQGSIVSSAADTTAIQILASSTRTPTTIPTPPQTATPNQLPQTLSNIIPTRTQVQSNDYHDYSSSSRHNSEPRTSRQLRDPGFSRPRPLPLLPQTLSKPRQQKHQHLHSQLTPRTLHPHPQRPKPNRLLHHPKTHPQIHYPPNPNWTA